MRELKNSEVSFVSGGGPPPPEFPNIQDPHLRNQLLEGLGYPASGGFGFGGPDDEGGGSPDEWTPEDVEYAREVLENPGDYERGEVAWAQDVVDTDNITSGIVNGALIGAAFGPIGIIQGIYIGLLTS